MNPQNGSLFILLVSVVFCVSIAMAIKNRTINILPKYFSEICGETFSDRIISGKQANMGQFPWMARIHVLGEEKFDHANYYYLLYFSIQNYHILKDPVSYVVVR